MNKPSLRSIVLALSLLTPCLANTCEVFYDANFSSNPGWFTDQPLNYYWHTTSQTYRVQPEHHYPGYTPSRAGVKPLLLSKPLRTFVLKWDIKIASCDPSISIPVGLYDKGLTCYTLDPNYQYIAALAGNNPDVNNVWVVVAAGGGGPNQVISPVAKCNFNTWYTCELKYNVGTKMATFDVKVRDSQTSIWTTTLLVPGGFTNELMYLGSSTSGIGDDGTYPGIDPDARADGYIDNVWLGKCPPPCVLVPRVIGKFELDAKAALEANDLTVGSISYSWTNTVPCGTVMNQVPAEGTLLCDDKVVNLLVAGGYTPPGGPTMRADPATGIDLPCAQLNGTVLDDDGEWCRYQFVYWEVQNPYSGYVTELKGYVKKGQTFSQVVCNLKPNTQYEYYVKGTNSTGTNSQSGRQKFTTPPLMPY